MAPKKTKDQKLKNLLQDLLHAASAQKSEDDLFSEVIAHAYSLGFDHCTYGVRSIIPITRPKVILKSTYPEDWQEVYQKNYLTVDPIVHHGVRSLAPLVWTEKTFSKVPSFWEDARSYGLQYGWSQSCRNEIGVMGLLSVCRSNDQLTSLELAELEPHLVWLTQYAHLSISQELIDSELPELNLSSRECEVLRWTAEGKTSSEVGQILGLTERTVNFHINNASAKLGACNKTSAALRAAMLGLLF